MDWKDAGKSCHAVYNRCMREKLEEQLPTPRVKPPMPTQTTRPPTTGGVAGTPDRVYKTLSVFPN